MSNRNPGPDGSACLWQLGDAEVHVWHVALEGTPALEQARTLLSADECQRADRLRFEKNREEFCRTRAWLRRLLEAYGAGAAAEIAFVYSVQGKPELAAPREREGLQFNLSHTQGRAVAELTRGRRVGIDVERLRVITEAAGIVASHFAAEEQAEYQALADAQKLRGFLHGWTRKEAVVKALGVGLGYPLEQFAVSLAPGSPAQLVRRTALPGAGIDWHLMDVSLEADYVAALAVEGPPFRLLNRFWDAEKE